MDKVVAAMRFKQLDSTTASDLEVLITHNKQIDTARHHAVSMVLAVGGREIGEHESDIVFEIPLDQANVIRDVHSRLENDLEMGTTIGVGDDLRMAKKALDWAVENRPGTIKVMEPAIEPQTGENEKSFVYEQPEDVAIDQEGRPEQRVHKAEDDDGPDDWADEKEAISDEMKQKITGIVQMLKSKKEYLQSLQQSNPELYAGVLELVNSISSMAQAARMADADKHAKMITKVAQHLDRAEEKNLDDQAAAVLEMLIEAQQEHADSDEEERRARHTAARRRYDSRRKYAREHASKTGADEKFLMNLNRAMRK